MTHKKEEKFLIGGKIMLIGSHVGMKGKDMFLGSVKEALSYGANTFMVYTGAPQNTRRKKIEELRWNEINERTWNGNVCCSCTIYHQSCEYDET